MFFSNKSLKVKKHSSPKMLKNIKRQIQTVDIDRDVWTGEENEKSE